MTADVVTADVVTADVVTPDVVTADVVSADATRDVAATDGPTACVTSRQCHGQVCDLARGVCVDCLADSDCASGQYCTAASTCAAQTCHPGAMECVDVTHARTCDAHGGASTVTACGADQVCRAGACVTRVCPPGGADCATTGERRVCNPDGLGYTTAACAAMQSCRDGACVAWGCAPGAAECTSSVERRVCNADGLGYTAAACPTPARASATCAMGVCGFTCAAGAADCDDVAANGCEAALGTDANCGACGNACGLGTRCQGGTCVTFCTPGAPTLCSGTCVDLQTDVAHCGSCAVACAAPHAVPLCRAGACGVAGCVTGYRDCNGSAADGCETAGSCPLPSAGLVAHYPLDGSGSELIHGANATPYSVTWVADHLGNAGRAAHVQATGVYSGGYLQAGSNPNLPTGRAARTVSLWMRSLRNTTTWQYRSVVGYGSNNLGQRFGVSTQADFSAGTDRVLFTGQMADVTSGRNLLDNAWHHVAVTYDGATLRLYLDGAVDVSGALTLNTVGQVLQISKAPSVSSEFYSGDLDDVRVYDRALGADEVRALARDGG